MKILWIGVEIGPETREKMLSAGGQIRSAQVSEHNLLSGMKAAVDDIDTINGPLLSNSIFPVVPEEKWADEISKSHIQVGYKNAEYVNRLNKEKALCGQAVRWAEENKNASDVKVIVYSMHAPFLAAAKTVKKNIPGAQIVLIVPDLPQYMDLKKNALKKILKSTDWLRIKALLKYVDQYVLYTEHMASFLKLDREKWLLMEGSYDTELSGERTEEPDGKHSVMYSGVLDLRYGIPELLDAMKYLDDSFELWLTGNGNARELIEKTAEKDGRIKYLGFLPTRKDLLDKQASATMLVNPRKDTEEASKYCFPSKILEYMASGRPVLSCYLPGIPEEYRPYLVEIKSITAENIADSILKASKLTDEQLREMGEAAKQFVAQNKNKYAQAARIISFMNKAKG